MPESYAYHVGDLVNARTAGGSRPAIIKSIHGHDVTVHYIAKSRGLALIKQADLTPNNDFDWCGGIALDSLHEGSAVQGRYLHGEGGKQWHHGKITAVNSNGTFAISYNDGDYESSVRRENIRTKADNERPNPQLSQFKRRSMKQSFASTLLPAHGESAPPKAKAKPAKATADATKEAEAARKLARQKVRKVQKMKNEAVSRPFNYEEVRKSKQKEGFLAGEDVEAKHSKGWFNARIIGIDRARSKEANEKVYFVAWNDGDENERYKTVSQIRPRKTLRIEENRSPSKRKAAEAAAVHGRRIRSRTEISRKLGGLEGLGQRVLPDIAVRAVKEGKFAGRAGAFATRDYQPEDVISIYAGKLMLRSDLKTAQGAMLTMKAKAEWPPQRGHPLAEAVLATEYEWGPLRSKHLDRVLPPDEELVIMPYPTSGNQTMAVNPIEHKDQENCIYITVTYKGFPYIVLLAKSEIYRGEELRVKMPLENVNFHRRMSCDLRFPGLVSLLAKASGGVSLLEPEIDFETLSCERTRRIYFVDDTKVEEVQIGVEREWAREHGDAELPFEDMVEIRYSGNLILDQANIKAQLRPWLEPAVGDKREALTKWDTDWDIEKKVKKPKTAMKMAEDPCAPKRGKSSFLMFLQSRRDEWNQLNPDCHFTAMTKALGEQWREMSSDEKAPYELRAQEDKQRYLAEKAIYDAEDRESGGLGGGGVAAFEDEMVAMLRVIQGDGVGFKVNKWEPKKKVLDKIKDNDSLWSRWCSKGYTEQKLIHFIQRLQQKYAEQVSGESVYGSPAEPPGVSGQAEPPSGVTPSVLTQEVAKGLTEEQRMKLTTDFDIYKCKNNDTVKIVSSITGVPASVLIRLNKTNFPELKPESRLKDKTSLRLNDSVHMEFVAEKVQEGRKRAETRAETTARLSGEDAACARPKNELCDENTVGPVGLSAQSSSSSTGSNDTREVKNSDSDVPIDAGGGSDSDVEIIGEERQSPHTAKKSKCTDGSLRNWLLPLQKNASPAKSRTLQVSDLTLAAMVKSPGRKSCTQCKKIKCACRVLSSDGQVDDAGLDSEPCEDPVHSTHVQDRCGSGGRQETQGEGPGNGEGGASPTKLSQHDAKRFAAPVLNLLTRVCGADSKAWRVNAAVMTQMLRSEVWLEWTMAGLSQAQFRSFVHRRIRDQNKNANRS